MSNNKNNTTELKKLGKRPTRYVSSTLRYKDVKGSNLPVPTWSKSWGYGIDFTSDGPQPNGWGMLGNGPCDDGSITDTSLYAYNGSGNCYWAELAHIFMELEHNAKGSLAPFTCASVQNNYAKYLGLASYTDITANNDEGTDLQDAFSKLVTEGFADANGTIHDVGAFYSVEPGNFTDLWEMLYLGEAVTIGINFPESAMDQFNAGKMWSYVAGAQIDGGHAICVVGRPAKDIWTVITWGKRQLVTQKFLEEYMDEAYGWVTPERYNSVTGKTLQGFDSADLEAYFAQVGTEQS